MHKLGIFLAVMVVLLGVGAFYFSARVMDVQTAWIKKLEEGDKRLMAAREEAKKKRAELAAKNAEYDRIMLAWDWVMKGSPVQVAVNPAEPSIQAALSPTELVALKDGNRTAMPVVYAFQADAANTGWEYVGEFLAADIRPGGSKLVPNWRVRPGDVAFWKGDRPWRFRYRIPMGYKTRLDDIGLQFALQDQRLASLQAQMNRLDTELTPKVDKVLGNRESEIAGFDGWDDKRGKLPDDAIDGVLAALATEEEARNAALEEANNLRHELLETIELYERLNRLNRAAAAEPNPLAAPKTASVSQP